MTAAPAPAKATSWTAAGCSGAARAARDASEVSVTERWGRCLKILLPTGSLLTRGTRVGQFPQPVEGVLDVARQGDGVQDVPLLREGRALGGRQDPGGEDA